MRASAARTRRGVNLGVLWETEREGEGGRGRGSGRYIHMYMHIYDMLHARRGVIFGAVIVNRMA